MKKFISILMVFLMLMTMTSFSAFATSDITLNVSFNKADSSLNISGIIDSARDRIPLTLHISRNGTTIAGAEIFVKGKTEAGVPFTFNPIILGATIPSGTLDIEVTASMINIKKSTTFEYVGIDNQFNAIKRVDDAQKAGNLTLFVQEVRATADDLGIDISTFDDLSDSAEVIAKEVLSTLALNLPEDFSTEERCSQISEEIEKYKDKYCEAVALGEFFDVTSAGDLKAWYDTYKTVYGFLVNIPATEADETKMLSYFDEAIMSEGYLNRLANMSSIRKIEDLNIAMKHQALLQEVEDSHPNIISRLLTDFPQLFTGVNYQGYNSLTTTQQSAVNIAVTGKVYSSLNALANEINAQILVASTSTYVPGESNTSTGGKGGKGGTGNYLAPAESLETVKTELFDDIDSVSWAKEAIIYLYDAGIVSGKGNNKFAPNDNVTRAELAKMLVLGFGLESKGDAKIFKDVATGAWYADYVSVAASNGLINGDEKGRFNPDKPVTRQDAAVMMYRAIKTDEKTEKAFFEDYNDIADYSEAAVDYMYQKGIINGIGDGKFAPKSNVTRVQVAKMLYLLLV